MINFMGEKGHAGRQQTILTSMSGTLLNEAAERGRDVK
jgi:hypothetical protein